MLSEGMGKRIPAQDVKRDVRQQVEIPVSVTEQDQKIIDSAYSQIEEIVSQFLFGHNSGLTEEEENNFGEYNSGKVSKETLTKDALYVGEKMIGYLDDSYYGMRNIDKELQLAMSLQETGSDELKNLGKRLSAAVEELNKKGLAERNFTDAEKKAFKQE